MSGSREYFELLAKVEREIAKIKDPRQSPDNAAIFNRTYELREMVNQLYEIANEFVKWNYKVATVKIPLVGESGIYVNESTGVKRAFEVTDVYDDNSFVVEYTKSSMSLPKTGRFVLLQGKWKPASMVEANKSLTELNRQHVLLGKEADIYSL